MSFTISKEFEFCSSHQLSGLPADHPCSRLHGHNYTVVFSLAGDKLNDVGFITDYRELDSIKGFIAREVDHRHLNELVSFNPTAENLAKWFFDLFKEAYPHLKSITVKETPKTSATYEPKN